MQGVAAYSIEYSVNVLHNIFKSRDLVVDYLIGPQCTNEVHVCSGGRGDDMRTALMIQLHDKVANRSGSTMDQNALATLKFQFLKSPLTGGQGGNRGHS